MALDFPNTPTVNQQFTGSNGVTYQFDGVAWRALGQSGGSLDWSNLTGIPPAFPPQPHVHEPGEVVGLQGALDGKAPLQHTHQVADLRVPEGTTAGLRLVTLPDGSIGFVAAAVVESPLAYGTAPPEDPAQKPFWFDTNAGVLMVHYDDGTSAQWVPAVPGAGGGTAPPPDTGGSPNQITTRTGTALTGRDGATIETR